VYNAVDIERFAPPDQDASVPDRDTVLFVGRLSPEKGVHILLDAFECALRVNPRLRLEIIGHDMPAPMHIFEHLADAHVVASLRRYYDRTAWTKLRTWLRSRYPRRLRRLKDTGYGAVLRASAARRMPDEVRFLGFVANEDLPQHYRHAQVACLPSLTETFGMPLVESMACGVPTIASAAGGIPEIVSSGITGTLVPVFDVDALARAILAIVADPQRRRRMGRAARERAVSSFSWQAVVATLTEIYEHAMNEPSTIEATLEARRHNIAALS
jgi:glycosyltransferase involved in cell wall biosynthesis